MQPDNDKTREVTVLSKGTIINHYRIIEKIGAGGMGEVYLAEDTSLNRKVALKFLSAHLCQDSDCRARFKREAQAAAKLDHPNIVTVYEVGEFQGRPFFAMQHIEGRSLREYAHDQELTVPQILEIGIQIAQGLQAAHEKGVAHRDIKPANILIDTHGRARILDFGLASVAGVDPLTKTGSTLGTVGYMSPEQVRGEQVDHRTDIFSLGVVLYELIAGRQPFKGDSNAATSRNILDIDPEPIARYKSGASAELQRVINKALAKDRKLRYQHADELAADLRQGLSPGDSPQTTRSGGTKLVVIAVAVLLLAVVAVVFKPWQYLDRSSAQTAIETNRVVVVPFRNQTGDPSLDPIGKMVADWTSQSLLSTGRAEVVPPDAIPGFDANKDVREIAKAAGASTVIFGSYYKVGDSIQFQSQIMRVNGNLLQAGDPIYTPRTKIMEGVELVRQRVLGALMFAIDRRLEGADKTSKPPTYEAYLQFMQGGDLFTKKFDYAAAIPFYARACALDTTFMMPLVSLTAAYFNLGQLAQADSVLKILEAKKSQLFPIQQLTVDQFRADIAGDLMGALTAARAEAALVPSPEDYYIWGWTAFRTNRPSEAIEAFKKADTAVIWSPNWDFLANAYHLLGSYEKAIETAQDQRRHYPTDTGPYFTELYALAAMGQTKELRALVEAQTTIRGIGTPAGVRRHAAEELRAHGHENEAMALLDEAVRWYEGLPSDSLNAIKEYYGLTLYYARRWDKAKNVYEELAKRSPKDSTDGHNFEFYLGLIAARQGDRARAMEVFDWLKNLKTPYQRGGPTYERACIAAILGEKEQAVNLLKESFLQGASFTIGWHKDFDLESLWDYPPFIEFMRPKG